jgi:hypothetical protein
MVSVNMFTTTVLLLLHALLLQSAECSLDFFMDAQQTELLYGVKTDKGIYYIKDGVVNQYAMTFQDQVRGTKKVVKVIVDG